MHTEKRLKELPVADYPHDHYPNFVQDITTITAATAVDLELARNPQLARVLCGADGYLTPLGVHIDNYAYHLARYQTGSYTFEQLLDAQKTLLAALKESPDKLRGGQGIDAVEKKVDAILKKHFPKSFNPKSSSSLLRDSNDPVI